MPRNRRSARTIVPIYARLGNSEVGELLDSPILGGEGDHDLVLTSDQWLALRFKRARMGRPLHFAEIQWPDEDRDHLAVLKSAKDGKGRSGKAVRHGRHRAGDQQVRA